MLIFYEITMFFGGKCACNEKLDMKWIEIASQFCALTLISSLEQTEAIYNVKYEIVPCTPYSKARWNPPQVTKKSREISLQGIWAMLLRPCWPQAGLGLDLKIIACWALRDSFVIFGEPITYVPVTLLKYCSHSTATNQPSAHKALFPSQRMALKSIHC